MLKKDVKPGGLYAANVSGKRVLIRLGSESRYGGWNAVNLTTGREVRIRTAARLTEAYPERKTTRRCKYCQTPVVLVREGTGAVTGQETLTVDYTYRIETPCGCPGAVAARAAREVTP